MALNSFCKFHMAAVTLQLCNCAYRLQIPSIYDNTIFMLQFVYVCCRFEIGKCAYKLQIALIDGATFKIKFAYGFCKLWNMQMSLQIKKIIKRWRSFGVQFSFGIGPKKCLQKIFIAVFINQKNTYYFWYVRM